MRGDAGHDKPGGGSEGLPDFQPQVVSSRTVHRGKIVNIRTDEITTPRGAIVSRDVVEHPGAVVVVAVDAQSYVYFVRQYRHAIGSYLIELPAGGLEPGEQPLAAAQRELREEVGLQAKDWTPLGSFYSSPGFANEHLHAFLAQSLVPVAIDPDDDEDIEVVRYPLHRLPEAINELADAKTLAALYLFERTLAEAEKLPE